MGDIVKDRADWLLDAVATATQDRQFLRDHEQYNAIVGEAILLNGEKAMRQVEATAFLAGVKAGLEAAKGVAIAYDGKPIRAASGWGHEQRDYHEAGQLDASASISSAIAAIDPTTIKPVTEE